MAKSIKLEVITPSKLFYKGDVELVICRTLTGEEGFMADHAWACKLLDIGELCIKEIGKEEYKIAAVAGGYVDVKDMIIIYTDAAEWSTDIDMQRALSAKESAQAFLDAHGDKAEITKNTKELEKNLALAKIELAKAITRMKVASGSRRKH